MLTKHTLLMGAVLSIQSCLGLAAAGEHTSDPVLQSTKSAFKYQLYTTNVLAWASGERTGLVQGGQGPMAKALEKLLNGATKRVDMAIYGVGDQEWVFPTLEGLITKGVEIAAVVDQKAGMVGDWSPENFTYPDTSRLPTVLPEDQVVPDQSKNGKARSSTIMHDKFLTVDDRYVWTGSSNLSHTCMGSEYNANVSILIDSPAVAAIFDNEFRSMHDNKLFGKNKGDGASHNLEFSDGTQLGIYFSPEDDAIHSGVVPFIEEAKTSLDIAMFYLTDADVILALQNAAQRGVKVRLIYDAVAAAHPSSEHQALREAGLEVRVENWGGKMHMKSAIADHRNVIIGSMNWTDAGNNSNDENTLVIRNNKKLAKELSQYFDGLWSNLSHSVVGDDPRAEGPHSINSCFDGIDNDHDGLVDSSEPGCKSRVKH